MYIYIIYIASSSSYFPTTPNAHLGNCEVSRTWSIRIAKISWSELQLQPLAPLCRLSTNIWPTFGETKGEYSIHGACQLMFVDGLLMFVGVCWCLLMFVASNCVYIYIYLEEPLVGIDHRYQLDVHGPLGLLESFHTPFCCHALNGLGNLYVSMCLVVGSLYVCWWIHVSIHVSQVNMPHFSWLNSSGVVMKTSIWLIFVGQILDCPCRTTKKKLRWYSLLMVAFNHQPWFHPIKWVIYFILRFQTCLDENHDVVENSWVPPKFKKNLIFAVRPTHRASLNQI